MILVVPAAGYGTRMRTVDPDVAKEMLRLGGRPVIDYAVREGFDAGCTHVAVIIRRGKEDVRRHLSAMHPSVELLIQERPRGEMDAVALAENLAAGEPVAVLYPDNIYLPAPGALRHLAVAYAAGDRDVVALTRLTAEQAAATADAGRVDTEPETGIRRRILRFLPKGPGRFEPRFPGEPRATGIAIYGPHLFAAICRSRSDVPPGEEVTDRWVRQLLLAEPGIDGVLLPGTVFDIGNPAGYARCQEAFARA